MFLWDKAHLITFEAEKKKVLTKGESIMEERIYTTSNGDIHYYLNIVKESQVTLIFLPGLTADHTLFDKQIEYFEEKYSVLAWDAPGHADSRPFSLDFYLSDKAIWLKGILDKEGIVNPVLVGQSMGGYVGQAFCELYPDVLKGYISIDSAPLKKEYTSNFVIWLLKHTEPMYRMYSWKALLKAGSKGVATTEYGQKNMYEMMMGYDSNSDEYYKLISHGYKMLAEAIEKDLPYEIKCKALLICGEKDRAGSAKSYNKIWSAKSGIPIKWIKDAGHNANADKPDEINEIIDDFIGALESKDQA